MILLFQTFKTFHMHPPNIMEIFMQDIWKENVENLSKGLCKGLRRGSVIK